MLDGDDRQPVDVVHDDTANRVLHVPFAAAVLFHGGGDGPCLQWT